MVDHVTNVVLIGSVGVGKSLLMNSFVGQAFSESNHGVDYRVTKDLVTIQKGFTVFSDVPGIDDFDGDDLAIASIETAIRSQTKLKIIFVIKLINGRAFPSEFVAMKHILDSLEEMGISVENNYGIIVNKWESSMDSQYERDFLVRFVHEALSPTENILFYPFIAEAESKKNYLLKGKILPAFLEAVPTINSESLTSFKL